MSRGSSCAASGIGLAAADEALPSRRYPRPPFDRARTFRLHADAPSPLQSALVRFQAPQLPDFPRHVRRCPAQSGPVQRGAPPSSPVHPARSNDRNRFRNFVSVSGTRGGARFRRASARCCRAPGVALAALIACYAHRAGEARSARDPWCQFAPGWDELHTHPRPRIPPIVARASGVEKRIPPRGPMCRIHPPSA